MAAPAPPNVAPRQCSALAGFTALRGLIGCRLLEIQLSDHGLVLASDRGRVSVNSPV
jgi:hypothetical protein